MRHIHSMPVFSARQLIAALMCLMAVMPAFADRLELLSGGTLEGEVVGRDAQSITIRVSQGGQTLTRKFPLDRVKALVTGDKRETFNNGSAEGGQPSVAPPTPAATTGKVQRSKAEIEALIDQQGRTAPDWWESTPLEYPQTLDLSWPEPAPGPWNARRNVGQYLWEVINPNPGKWRSGTRFVHHLLGYHKSDPQKQLRIMNTLGRIYFQLLEDYPRAAFWFRRAGVEQNGQFFHSGILLAECYWRLGSKEMALELLNRCPVQFGTIKLLGDMGETQAALRLADANAQGPDAGLALLCAGDVCRMAGDHARALQYYQKSLQVGGGRNAQYAERQRRRAQANIDGIRAFELLDLKRVPDGTYTSASQGYEAEVGIEVVVKGGRIESVRVIKHREKQFYSSMIDTPRKIIARQGVTGIDATSGATITSEAIVNATAKALTGAMK